MKIINKNIDLFGFKYLNFKLLNKAFVKITNNFRHILIPWLAVMTLAIALRSS